MHNFKDWMSGCFVLDAGGGGAGVEIVDRFTNEEKTELIARLQALFDAAGAAQHAITSSNDYDAAELECNVCMEPLTEDSVVVFRACKHFFCGACTDRLFPHKAAAPCPMCRTMIQFNDYCSFRELVAASAAAVGPVVEGDGDADGDADVDGAGHVEPMEAVREITRTHSSKTLEVLKALGRIRDESPGEKTVIFSSFVGYLDILQGAIEEDGYNVARIDGKVSQKARAAEIRKFTNDETITVILCSIKACGVGITLTRANHIFLTDLWWAPSVDMQAIDRVHRIGQTRPVNVLRFLVHESIDEKIYKLQLKKMELAKMAFEKEKSAAAQRAERMRDIQELLA
jgi:SNF2 family DNA or RNA helicase